MYKNYVSGIGYDQFFRRDERTGEVELFTPDCGELIPKTFDQLKEVIDRQKARRVFDTIRVNERGAIELQKIFEEQLKKEWEEYPDIMFNRMVQPYESEAIQAARRAVAINLIVDRSIPDNVMGFE